MGIIWFRNFKGLLNPWYMFIGNTMSLVKYLCLESCLDFYFFWLKRLLYSVIQPTILETGCSCKSDQIFYLLYSFLTGNRNRSFNYGYSIFKGKELPWRILRYKDFGSRWSDSCFFWCFRWYGLGFYYLSMVRFCFFECLISGENSWLAVPCSFC